MKETKTEKDKTDRNCDEHRLIDGLIGDFYKSCTNKKDRGKRKMRGSRLMLL